MSFGEKYQAFLDKINTRLPIKILTGPLDRKNPLISFFVFLAIIVVVLFLVFGNSFTNGTGKGTYTEITIKIADENNNVLKNFPFKIKDELVGEDKEYFTDNSGKQVVSLLKNGSYTFLVEKKGYKLFTESIDTSSSEFKVILKLFALPSTSSKTLSFVDSKTKEVIKDTLDVVIKCENGTIINPSSLVVIDGNYTFDVPNDCGDLVATITSNNYYSTGVLIQPTQTIVNVTANQVAIDKGNLNVTVKSGDLFIDDITIKVFEKDDLINPIKIANTQWSMAKIKDIPIGDYSVVASDPSNQFLSSTIDVTIVKDATLEKTINLASINPDGTATIVLDNNETIIIQTRILTASLKDEVTNQDINVTDAKVVLLLDCNSVLDQRQVSQGITFVVDSNNSYCLRGEAEGYIPEIVNINSTNNNYNILLEKITISNVSDINALVIDEDNLPVVAAKVILYDGNTNYIDVRYDALNTDENGKITFNDIPVGYFYLKVKKVYLEGDSSKFNHVPPVNSNINVLVNIGDGTLKLDIKDKLGDVVPEADIKIYTQDGNLLGSDFGSSSGTYQKEIKADKRIYVVITKNGFIPYFTELLTINKNITISKEIVMNRDDCQATVPCIDYLGVYTPEGNLVTKFENNKMFYLKYRLINGTNSANMGFVLKVGLKDKVSLDNVYIKPITLNKSVATYFADYPFIQAVQEGTEAKLVDVFFSSIEKGTFELTIPLQVHDAADQDMIPVYFKSYYGSSSSYINNSTFTKYEYYVGVQELCSDTFCFSGQYIDVINDLRYDIESNMKIPMLVNSEYKLEYKIKNAKDISYENGRLKIFNSDLESYPTQKVKIESYLIEGAFNKGENAGTTNYFKIPFNEDELTNQTIDGYSETSFLLNIFPISVDNTYLAHKIIAGQEEIYNFNLALQAKNLYTMKIDYLPINILPNNTFDMLLTIKDEQNKPVEDARINIYSELEGYEYSIYLDKYTDSSGKLSLVMPPLVIGSKLIIEAEKPSYFAERKEIIIDSNITKVLFNNSLVSISSPVTININKNNLNGDIQTIEIQNLTNYDLELNEINASDVSFNYSNLLDLGQTLTFINSQINNNGKFIILANEKRELNVKITPGVDSLNLVENQEVIGSITGHVNTDGEAIYPFNIPIKVIISVGKGVATNNCLVAQGYVNPWVTTINSGKSQTISFEIINNCRSFEDEEKPLALKNIRAKILSEGDKYGYYDLTVNTSTARLAEGVYKTIIEDVEADRTYSGSLTYSSGSTKFGLIKTKVYLNAQVETEDGLVYVNNGDGEVLVNTEISIMEISDCFKFYDGTKEIGDSGMFVIDSEIIINQTKDLVLKNTCSDKGRFKVTLSGGMTYSSSGLTYENYDDRSGEGDFEYNFNIGDSEKIISVRKPDVPGAYMINVKIESLNNNLRAVSTVYRPLKVNVKDLLYMEDPFLEVAGDATTMPVKLYNKDLNRTPWDYATAYTGEEGFGKYMNDQFYSSGSWNTCQAGDENCLYNGESSILRMKFNDKDSLVNAGTDGPDTYQSAAIGGGAAAAIGIILIVSTSLALGPVGIAAAAVFVIASSIAPLFYSDYDIDNQTRYLDISQMNSTDGLEVSKIITLSNLEDENAWINVFDITGARYYKYFNQQIHAHGKLASTKEISNSLPKCNGLPNLVPVESYLKVYNKPSFCGEISIEETEESYLFKTSCSGQLVNRFKLDLWYDTFSVCKFDQTYWPDQAGMKPLEFNLNSSLQEDLAASSTLGLYKTITFYPTLDDTSDVIDSAFIDAKPISQNGKFRFEFHEAPKQEIINVDLNSYACSTDSDKTGKTGPGAVPNVSLDWDWKDLSNIDKCNNTYCDATQISQVVLNRIEQSQSILDSSSISCPKSYSQVLDDVLEGTYEYIADPSSVQNQIPAGKVGITSVNMQTQENNFKVKVVIENNTVSSTSGDISISLENKEVTSIEYYDYLTGTYVTEQITLLPLNYIYVKNITTPIGNDNTTEIIFTFKENEMGASLPLVVTYTGLSTSYGTFNTDVTLQTHPASTSGCLVPAITSQFNGTDYIDMWFNKTQYPDNVQSEWSQDKITTLKNLLSFNAYLITDNYNFDFQDAFDKAYGGSASVSEGLGTYSFMSSPGAYSEGYLSPLFKNNLTYTLKYSLNEEGVEIKTPGLYNIRIDLFFNNNDWDFTTSNEDIDANVVVTFTYLKGPSENSVFYRLPFDGFVGYESNGYNRQGYGTTYLGDDVLITKIKDNELRTTTDVGSNPLRYLRVVDEQDIFKLNSDIESRGSVLKIINQENNQTEMIFSPSTATPIIQRIENRELKPFSVFYQLIKDSSSEPITGNASLTKWSGIGDGCDYSGDYIYSSFNNVSDYQSSVEDRLPGTYMLQWPTVNQKGNLYLRTIFYTPLDQRYTLGSKETGVNQFSYDGVDYSGSLAIPRLNNVITLKSIKDVFDNVSSGNICVANSSDGTYSEFFYNPVAIYGKDELYVVGPDDRLKCN